MDSACDTPLRSGLPHSEILGSKPARGSPRLVAACHVLHRLLAPRHPPDALAFLGPPQRQPHPRTREANDPARCEPGRRPDGRFQQQLALQKALPPRGADGRASIPMPYLTRPPTDGRPRRGARRIACQRPSRARRTRGLERSLACPRTGSHHHHTMSKEQNPARQAADGIRRMRRGRAAGEGLPFRDGRAEDPGHDGRPASRRMRAWWAWADLNGRPHAYQACALTN